MVSNEEKLKKQKYQEIINSQKRTLFTLSDAEVVACKTAIESIEKILAVYFSS